MMPLKPSLTHLCIFVGHNIKVNVLVDVHLKRVDHMKEEEGLRRVHHRQHFSGRLLHHVDVHLRITGLVRLIFRNLHNLAG